MKKMRLLSTFFVTVLLISILSSAGFAAGTDAASVVDYEEIFSLLGKTDGAQSELLAEYLVSAFDSDCISFISALALRSDMEIEDAASLLVYGKTYFDFSEFESIIRDIRASGNLSDAEHNVAEAIIDAVNRYHKRLEEEASCTNAPQSVEAPAFHAKTILRFIELNEEVEGIDEEYFNTIGNAFRADPEYFAEVTGVLPDFVIDKVAYGVAYDCIKNNYEVDTDRLSALSNNYVINKIISEFSEGEVQSDFTNNSGPENQENKSAPGPAPTVGAMTYTPNKLVLGSSATLRITFSESNSTSMTRSYWTEVYAVRDATYWLKSSKYITIPSGSSSVNVTYPMSFSDMGEIYTVVRVFTNRDGLILTSGQKAKPDIIYGKWNISIALPQDRLYKGTLALYNAKGSQVMRCECLGRSDSGASMMTEKGNTPTGIYTGQLGYTSGSAYSYGPYKVVMMEGVSGAKRP